jgi:hypothetical protein
MPGNDQQKRWTATVELCPVCHSSNITGNKYCYGPSSERHDKVRFEFVEVMPVADEQATRQSARAEALREAAEGLRNHTVQRADDDGCLVPMSPFTSWREAADFLESLATDNEGKAEER